MPDSIFRGLFDTDMTSVIRVSDFLLCMGCSLLIGLILSFGYMYRTRYTKSFIVTLALLPTVVCVVIMMVNGNIGAGVAVAGALRVLSAGVAVAGALRVFPAAVRVKRGFA